MDPIIPVVPPEQLAALGLAPDAVPDGADLILVAIASLDGGRNGGNPDRVLGITITGPGEAVYTLTDADDPGSVQSFTVTVV